MPNIPSAAKIKKLAQKEHDRLNALIPNLYGLMTVDVGTKDYFMDVGVYQTLDMASTANAFNTSQFSQSSPSQIDYAGLDNEEVAIWFFINLEATVAATVSMGIRLLDDANILLDESQLEVTATLVPIMYKVPAVLDGSGSISIEFANLANGTDFRVRAAQIEIKRLAK